MAQEQKESGDIQQIQLAIRGLYTNPNELSKVPPGALTEATNTVIDRDDLLEQRRGFKSVGTELNLGTDIVDAMYSYQSRLLLHYGETFAYDSTGSMDWVEYSGNYGIPDGAYAVHSVQANKNLYFSTDVGIQKLDLLTNALRVAGVPEALDGQGSTTGSGWFTNSTQVAYRIVWGYTDENNNLILGAPSQRIIVANNSGGSTNVSLTFTIPDDITTDYIYQIYRSPMSVDLTTAPNDECQLVIQTNPTSGEITAGTITLTDTVPDALRGATIYTANSQQGILQANYQPPLCVDLCFFKGFVFYANTTNKQNLSITLISVGASSGLVADDTITIDGVLYTAKASETAASGEFKVETGGTPSYNIEQTAKSLCHVINVYASNTTVYAYYVSGYNDLPGAILIKERGVGDSAFTVSVSRATAWYFPSATSMNDNLPAQVLVSKFQQPEAVPIINNLGGSIGSADQPILRIIALRNSVFVFKADGVFRITGDDLDTFSVTPWDNTVILRSPEAAVLLNNQIYCFTTQGIISVSETGSAIISRPIEKDLLEISAAQFTTFDSVTFGLGYESDRKYLLNTVTNEGDTVSTQTYVFNYITNAYTKWTLPHSVTAGILNPVDNKIYYASGDPDYKFILQERKSFTESDYADEEIAITIDAVSGTTLTVSDTTDLEEGYTLVQGFFSSEILEIVDATTIEVADDFDWEVDTATVYQPIEVAVQWAPIHGGYPDVMKLFKELTFFFSNPDFNDIDISISSNISQFDESFTITPISLAGWGTAPWGSEPFGGGRGRIQPIRTWPPLEKARAHWLLIKLTKSQALTTFALNGITIYAQIMSHRFR